MRQELFELRWLDELQVSSRKRKEGPPPEHLLLVGGGGVFKEDEVRPITPEFTGSGCLDVGNG